MRIRNKHACLWSPQQSRAPEKPSLTPSAPSVTGTGTAQGLPGPSLPSPAVWHTPACPKYLLELGGAPWVPPEGRVCEEGTAVLGLSRAPRGWILSHQHSVCRALPALSQFGRAHSPHVSHCWGLPRAGTSFLSPSLLVASGFGFSFLLLAPSPAGLALGLVFPVPKALGSSEEQPSCCQTSPSPRGCVVRAWGRQ